MAGHWTDVFSYVTGAVRLRDLGYTALVSDDLARSGVEHTYFSEWDNGTWGEWIAGCAAWSTVDGAVCQHPVPQGLFLGLRGEVLCGGSGDVHEETIRAGEPDSPENRGMMRGLGVIDGIAYAVGMQRQAYRRDGRDVWTAIDATARPDEGDGNVYGFEHISGFIGGQIYAAGRRGEIWRYAGGVWRQEESPTTRTLTRVCCADDGNVYLCGRFGTLVRGRQGRWELVEQDATRDDFWGLAWYGDGLYVSTTHTVFRLDGDRLTRVDFGTDPPSSCSALSSADGVLWSIGPKDVMAFDGQSWTRID